MRKNYRAFSMIEISMVLVLLAAIITGVMQTTTLIADSKLARARTLTKKSPVKDINGLVLWLETSLEESFILSEIENGSKISKWLDIKNNKLAPNHATQSNSDYQPTYQEKAFNGSIPAIRFDGSNDYLGFNGDFIINSPYTIFVVEKRTSNKDRNYFIAGLDGVIQNILILGYQTNTTIVQGLYGYKIEHTVPGYTNDVERIHTFGFDLSGKNYYLNGGSSPDASDSETAQIQSFNGAAIGRYKTTDYYTGDIAEIIIFNRALSNQDRNSVEEYLSKKYDIKLD